MKTCTKAALLLAALASGCPTPGAPVACADANDCDAAESCVVVDGEGVCRPNEEDPVAGEGEGEVEGEGEGEGEGERELTLSRGIFAGGARAQASAAFSLRGALTTSSRASSSSFSLTPRTHR